MQIEGSSRVYHRDENGVLKVDARLYGAMPPDMQREVEDELRRDNDRRKLAAAEMLALQSEVVMDEEPPKRIRDPMDSVGDALLDAARSLAAMATLEHSLADATFDASNRLADAGRLIHARTTRVWGS